MNEYWVTTIAMIFASLAVLFALAMRGEPLAIVALSVVGVLVVAVMVVLMVIAVDRNRERQFRANAEENSHLMQQQAKGLSDLGLAQQRQFKALDSGIVVKQPRDPQYSFGASPDVFAGFGDDEEINLLGGG